MRLMSATDIRTFGSKRFHYPEAGGCKSAFVYRGNQCENGGTYGFGKRQIEGLGFHQDPTRTSITVLRDCDRFSKSRWWMTWFAGVFVTRKRDIGVAEILWLVPHPGGTGRIPGSRGRVSGDRPNTDDNALPSIVRNRIPDNGGMVCALRGA